jgi:branched-chain amino acid transport system ATP-binding protein
LGETTILRVEGLTKSFGGLSALLNVSITTAQGEIRGLIGPNGAGKTTLINLITRFYRPDQGQIRFLDEDILKLPTHKVAAKGIARTFQTAEPFPGMTVLENVMVGRHIYGKQTMTASVLKLRKERMEEKETTEKALEMLRIVRLEEKKDQLAGSLAFGQLRLLEIARALASEPKLLCLDEPAAGMNPGEVDMLHGLFEDLRSSQNLTILLIEHNLNFVMRICDLITVLDSGEKIAEGSPEEIQNNQKVIDAYIGIKRKESQK